MTEILATLLAWCAIAGVALIAGAFAMLMGYSVNYKEGSDNGQA